MPQIPQYNGQQVATEALRPAYQSAPDVSSGTRALGESMFRAADEYATKQANTEAFNAQAKLNEDYVNWSEQERKASQGANAAGHVQRVTAWWDDARKKYSENVSPYAQQLIGRTLAQARQSALASAVGYETQQTDIGERSAVTASVSALQRQAISSGPDAAQPAIDAAVETLRKYGATKGLDMTPQIEQVTTGAHVTLINQMLQSDPARAAAYFETHKKEISATSWDEIGGKINHITALTDGQNKADEVWAATVKPGDYKNPIDLYAMEEQVRKAFKNDPTRGQAAVQALREKAAGWNKSQAEFTAGATNDVYKLLDSGMPLSKVMKSDAWNVLPGNQQHAITLQLEQQAAAREARAASAEQRLLAQMQRDDKLALLTNADQFLRYSDPDVLGKMSRQQVEALRPTFGFEGTQHLLGRFDSLQKPGAVAEARMDNEDFNHVADTMGLDPFNAKTPEKKQALGELKFRVEQMIDIAQRNKKATLTREEKFDLMRGELARTVTVNPGWLSFNKTMPVIQLKPDDAARVVVPETDKEQISEALSVMYKRDPSNPLYAPTDDNVRRLYLANRSRASALIEPKK